MKKFDDSFILNVLKELSVALPELLKQRLIKSWGYLPDIDDIGLVCIDGKFNFIFTFANGYDGFDISYYELDDILQYFDK